MLMWTMLIAWGISLPLALATVGALAASTVAGLSLSSAWAYEVVPRTRRLLLAAMLVLNVFAFYWTWWCDDALPSAAVGAALVSASVLLHRPMRWDWWNIDKELAESQARSMAGMLVAACLWLPHYIAHPDRVLRWAGTLLLADVAMVCILSLLQEFVSESTVRRVKIHARVLSGFFDQQSAVLPTLLGLLLLVGGGYGLLVRSNFEGLDWILYSAIAIAGFFVLKRTFSVQP